jgi:hypothetical protein
MRLAVLTGLRSLQLSVYGVTWEGIARLQKALPRLSVDRAITGPPRSCRGRHQAAANIMRLASGSDQRLVSSSYLEIRGRESFWDDRAGFRARGKEAILDSGLTSSP